MKNTEFQALKLHQWIYIGCHDAVVCAIYEDTPQEVEVVYLDDKKRAISEDIYWNNGSWSFKYDGPCGGYADSNPRLADAVAILRRGRY